MSSVALRISHEAERIRQTLTSVEWVERIGAGSQGEVYKIKRGTETFALKIPKQSDVNSAKATQWIRREAALLARLSHPSLPKILEVGPVNSPYFIMEYIEGTSLDLHLRQQGRIPENHLIAIAETLASALKAVHQIGLIHGDLKPQNILLPASPDQPPKLIDFGLAEIKGEMVGTILYLSPEQSGTIQRPVDARSDLYSLGVVLYECITGQPPFTSDDSGQIIHLHATAKPQLPSQNGIDITPEFEAILLKLLEKEPDLRFQSARELLTSLESLAPTTAVPAHRFTPTANSLTNSRVSAPLIGREEELVWLKMHWIQFSDPLKSQQQRRPRTLLIKGDPGAGKSTLIDIFLSQPECESALILRAKCQTENTAAFSVLRELAQQLLIPNPNAEYLEAIQKAAGAHPGLITRFCPPLSKLISSRNEPLPSDSLQEELQDLFYSSVANFFHSLSRELHRPVILFIDDIQWIDPVSRLILQFILQNTSTDPLFVLLAARTQSDPGTDSQLNELILSSILSENTSVQSPKDLLTPFILGLTLLDLKKTASLTHHYLGPLPFHSTLPEVVYQRSKGSPFAIIEVLRAMIDGGVLRPQWGQWCLDEDGLQSLSLPEDVIELVIRRLRDLNQTELKILQYAALLGSRFSLSPFKFLKEFSAFEVESAIQIATRAGLVQPQSADIHSSKKDDVHFIFIHDRIQEALFRSIPDDNRKDFSDTLLEALIQLPFGQFGDPIEASYSQARHVLSGHRQRQPKLSFEILNQAGALAHQVFAHQSAFDYLHAASEILVDQPQTSVPFGLSTESILRFYLLYADAANSVGKLELALSIYDRALQWTEDSIQRAIILSTQSRIHLARMQELEALEFIKKVFSAIGVPHPKVTPSYILVALVAWTAFLIRNTLMSVGSKQLTPVQKRRALVEVQLYAEIGIFAYFKFNIPLSVVATLRPLYASLRIGTSREVVLLWLTYGVLIGLLGFKKHAQSTVQRALAMAREIKHPSLIARAMIFCGICYTFTGEEKKAEATFNQTMDELQDALVIEDLVLISGCMMWTNLLRGFTDLTIRWARLTQERLDSVGNLASQANGKYGGWSPSYGMAAFAMRGETVQAEEQKRAFEAIQKPSPYARVVHAGNWICYCIETNALGADLDAAIQSWDDIKLASFNAPVHARQYLVFKVYARIEQILQATETTEHQRLIKIIKKDLFQLQLGAPIPMLKLHVIIAQAYLRFFDKDFARALTFLSRAALLAHEVDSPLGHFEIHLLRARIFQKIKNPKASLVEAKNALTIAETYSWAPRRKKIEAEFSITSDLSGSRRSLLSSTRTATPSSSWHSTLSTQKSILTPQSVKTQRFLDSILQLGIASSQVTDIRSLSQTVLEQTVKILHGERAFLFLIHPLTGDLEQSLGVDATGKQLENLTGYSRTVIEEVRKTCSAVVVSGTDEGPVHQAASVVAQGLKSIVCAPIQIQDELIGVIYLDSRFAKGIFTLEDVDLLTSLGSHIALAIKTVRSTRLEAEKASYQKDLEIVGAVQNLLLPKEPGIKSKTLELHSLYRPASQSGGDWWWVDHNPESGKTLLLLGDVTGHGAGSAMITATVAGAVRHMKMVNPNLHTEVLLRSIHELLCSFQDGQYWMTLSALEIDPHQRSLTWFGAGPPPLTIIDSQGQINQQTSRSSPLGSSPLTLTQKALDYQNNSTLFLFTDGAYEFEPTPGRRFGLRAWNQILQSHAKRPPDLATQYIWDDLIASCPESGFVDDITLVAIRLK